MRYNLKCHGEGKSRFTWRAGNDQAQLCLLVQFVEQSLASLYPILTVSSNSRTKYRYKDHSEDRDIMKLLSFRWRKVE